MAYMLRKQFYRPKTVFFAAGKCAECRRWKLLRWIVRAERCRWRIGCRLFCIAHRCEPWQREISCSCRISGWLSHSHPNELESPRHYPLTAEINICISSSTLKFQILVPWCARSRCQNVLIGDQNSATKLSSKLVEQGCLPRPFAFLRRITSDQSFLPVARGHRWKSAFYKSKAK